MENEGRHKHPAHPGYPSKKVRCAALSTIQKRTLGFKEQVKAVRLPFGLLLALTMQSTYPLKAQFLSADAPTGGIRINQIGYGTSDPKIAILDSYLFPGQRRPAFYLIALNQFADTVYSGQLESTGSDLYSKKNNLEADFTNFTKPGHYYLSIPGQGTSYPFVISQHPFNGLLKSVLKAYYYNRASMAITAPYGDKWIRKAGHTDTTVFVHPSAASKDRPAGTVIQAPGGWYDAGDYNKYIVNASITMHTLLAAFCDYPDLLSSLQLSIPAQSTATGKIQPDFLTEYLYNLRWMLQMQDPGDGGVYHKLTSAGFDPMELPQKDKDKRYVVQKSTAATLDFASVMAVTSWVFKKTGYSKMLPGLTDSLMSSAHRAWQWAIKHPDIIYDQDALNKIFKPKITTGTYGDKQITDEWYLAAVSLLMATQDPDYLTTVMQYAPARATIQVPAWNSVATIGAIWLSKINTEKPDPEAASLFTSWSAQDLEKLSRLQKQATGNIRLLASQLCIQPNPGFKTIMGGRKQDFNWGSNSNAANQGWVLMTAYKITGQAAYKTAALSNLDYLLGRNTNGYCFVTGFGALSPLHPHHRISISDEIDAPVPGFLVGGPNPGRQDGVKGYPEEKDRPDMSYLDNDQAYSVNEVAINWNAPLVYLIAAIQATEKKEH
jgi:endoglucanase